MLKHLNETRMSAESVVNQVDGVHQKRNEWASLTQGAWAFWQTWAVVQLIFSSGLHDPYQSPEICPLFCFYVSVIGYETCFSEPLVSIVNIKFWSRRLLPQGICCLGFGLCCGQSVPQSLRNLGVTCESVWTRCLVPALGPPHSFCICLLVCPLTLPALKSGTISQFKEIVFGSPWVWVFWTGKLIKALHWLAEEYYQLSMEMGIWKMGIRLIFLCWPQRENLLYKLRPSKGFFKTAVMFNEYLFNEFLGWENLTLCTWFVGLCNALTN